MISRVRGVLLGAQGERVEVATPGGVVYEVEVPLTVVERLPPTGEEVELRTVLIIREDHQALFGFLDLGERALFQRLLATQGVGAKLALSMLSTFAAPRLARALAERDVAALTRVPGIGKKTAQRLILELAEKMEDLELEGEGSLRAPEGAQAAVQALIALGMTYDEADARIRTVLRGGGVLSTQELIRLALGQK